MELLRKAISWIVNKVHDLIHSIGEYFERIHTKKIRMNIIDGVDDYVEKKQDLPVDIFDRDKIAEQMCDVLCACQSENISPAILDGPWGCGKTIQAKRLIDILNSGKYKTSHKCIYWNAALSDFSASPLPHFVARLYECVEANRQKEFQAQAQILCAAWAFAITKAIVKGAISKTINVDISEIIADAKNAENSISGNDNLAETRAVALEAKSDLKRIEAARKIIDYVRDGKELVIIIDELDRCRPNYALEMLESIKYLFGHTHCKFIIVMNSKLIISSISNMYGLDESDSKNYLDKYVKVHLILPDTFSYMATVKTCVCTYFNHLLEVEKVKLGLKPNAYMNDFIKTISAKDGLQLRDIEKIVNTILFIKKSSSDMRNYENNECYSLIICLVSYLFAFRKKEFADINQCVIDSESLLVSLGYVGKGDYVHEQNRVFIRDLIESYYASLSADAKPNQQFSPSISGKFDPAVLMSSVSFMTRWVNASKFIR